MGGNAALASLTGVFLATYIVYYCRSNNLQRRIQKFVVDLLEMRRQEEGRSCEFLNVIRARVLLIKNKLSSVNDAEKAQVDKHRYRVERIF